MGRVINRISKTQPAAVAQSVLGSGSTDGSVGQLGTSQWSSSLTEPAAMDKLELVAGASLNVDRFRLLESPRATVASSGKLDSILAVQKRVLRATFEANKDDIYNATSSHENLPAIP